MPTRFNGYETFEALFESKVDRSDVDGCHVWTDKLNENGYGKISVNAVPKLAHRVSWELTHGPIMEGLCVLHDCDNPSCVRTQHLFLGTQQDNVKDMHRKHRGSSPPLLHGTKHPKSKLTDVSVRQIRKLYTSGKHSQKSLAKQFGVAHSLIYRVIHRKVWTHI